MKLDRYELAWAAGFYDGEGCTKLASKKRSGGGTREMVRMVIGQVRKDVLLRFKSAVGGLGKIYGPYEQANENWQAQWVYAAQSFEQAQAVFALLWDYLSSEKREQAEKCFMGIRKYHKEVGKWEPKKCFWGHIGRMVVRHNMLHGKRRAAERAMIAKGL